jgi:hypothetical protein
MTDERLERLLRTALAADLPELQPTPAEVRAALRAARERPARRRLLAPAPRRAALAPAWAMALVLALVVALGTVTAVPGARAAVLGAIDRLERFLGGGEPPGVPLPLDDPVGALDALNFLSDAAPGSPRVLARAGDERLVAFRGRRPGRACLSLGRHLNECGDAAHWSARLTEGAVAPLIATPADGGRAALWGVAQDVVTRVELRYADGGTVATPVAFNGFVLIADPARAPRELVARRADGREVARADLSGIAFRFCTNPEGCG